MQSKILDRIKKLLSKVTAAEGSDCEAIQNEANASLQAATNLMEKHGITEADVRKAAAKEGIEIAPDAIKDTCIFTAKKIGRWDKQIAVAVARAFDGEAITYTPARNNTYGIRYQGLYFIGLEEEGPVAVQIFKYLQERLRSAAKAYKQKTFCDAIGMQSYKDGFCIALVQTGARIANERKNKNDEVPAGNMLVPINQVQEAKKHAVSMYLANRNVRYAPREKRTRDIAAESAGYTDGSRLHFGKDTIG